MSRGPITLPDFLAHVRENADARPMSLATLRRYARKHPQFPQPISAEGLRRYRFAELAEFFGIDKETAA